ncbi:MAG: ABC transporter permease [Bacteroidales bacterium]|jgi:putative ABC transport system permease protein|nr:ABC transporter permease [Bacteroidales bacterium]
MIKNFFLTAFRNAFKNWTYSIINILGLSTGLAAIIYITLFVQFELGYDKLHEKADQIYRVGVYGMMMNNELNQAVTAAPMAEAMINDYSEVLNACRINKSGDWLIRYGDVKFNEKEFLFADSTFFEVFSFKLLKGDPKTALTKPNNIVITETGARKYFGNEDPIGKMLRVESDTALYEIVGLMEDPPENSHFHFDLLGSMSRIGPSRNTFWVSHNFYTYIILAEGTDQAAFEEKMQSMVEKYVGPQIEQFLGIKMEEFASSGNSFSYFIQPLLDIHLRSDLQAELETNGNIQYIYIFISIAIFILVIASINFTNLSTARASKRSKEVGIRKVVGAMKQQLVVQFLMESFLITLVSLGLAIILLELFLPGLNNLVHIPLEISYFANWYIVPSLFLLVFIVSLMAGSYPAFFLASFRPVAVLKGKLKIGVKGGILRSVLVITQFVVSVFILLSTFTVSDQLKYMLNKDLGFEKENVLMIRRSDALKTKMEAFKAELQKRPSVINVTNSNTYPGNNFSNNAFWLEGESTSNTYLLHQARVSFDYGKTLNFELKQGRFFSRDFATDSNAIVINEAAVKSLGLEDPIGKNILQPGRNNEFLQRPIIGVVKDFNFKSLHTKIEPVAFTLMRGNNEGVVSVKLEPGNISSSIQQIQNVWDEFETGYPFEYFFFDDHLKEMYTAEQRTNSIFVLFTILSILISFLGLLGLISFITEQRKKEIGVRKTFGSSTGNIVVIISKGILKLIVIASIVSWPIAYWVMNNWLQDFSYRVDINLVMFVVIPVLTIILSLLTVIYQTVKAARKNPAETLRYE